MHWKVLLLCLLVALLLANCSTQKLNVDTASAQTTTSFTTPSHNSTPTIQATGTLLPTMGSTVFPKSTPTPAVGYRIYGVIFGLYLTEYPAHRAFTSEEEIRRLMKIIAPYTYGIRTYGCGAGLNKAGKVAHELGMQIAAGAWLGKDLYSNGEEINCLIKMAQAGDVDLAVIGNEALQRKDLTEKELLAYIDRFREEVPWVPVTSAETRAVLLDHPGLVRTEDIVSVNLYPYSENIGIQDAAGKAEEWYVELSNFVGRFSYGKQIIITGTGWPSCGENGSLGHENFYFGSFVSMTRAWDIPFFWFEAFDEPGTVNVEGEAGSCWGLWDQNGELKKGLDFVFTGVVGGHGEPEIEIKDPFPGMSDPDFLSGYVSHVVPQDYRVVVYVYIPGSGWWIKPNPDSPLTEIDRTGWWTCPIITAKDDAQATKIEVFLVPKDYSPPLAAAWEMLPQEIYDQSVANTATSKR